LANAARRLLGQCEALEPVRTLAETLARQGLAESSHSRLLKALVVAKAAMIAGDPDQQGLEEAGDAAEGRREQGQDPDFLGHLVLYLLHRRGYLDGVRRAAERYVHFGLDEADHARLLQALDAARREEAREQEADQELGLG
jgi:hypothetical protein